MANTKKTIETDKKSVSLNSDVDNSIDMKDFIAQMEAMKKQLDKLQSENQQLRNTSSGSKRYITIGCNVLENITLLQDKDDKYGITIPMFGVESIDYDTAEKMKRRPDYRDLFVKGILYYEDEAIYSEFKINKMFDLSENGIKNIVDGKEAEQICSVINKMTNNKKDSILTYHLMYLIIYYNKMGKVVMSYDTMSALERYFGVERGLLENGLQHKMSLMK